jgi:hypothetical protein
MTALQKPERYFYHSPQASRPIQSRSAVAVQRPALLGNAVELFADAFTLNESEGDGIGRKNYPSGQKPR